MRRLVGLAALAAAGCTLGDGVPTPVADGVRTVRVGAGPVTDGSGVKGTEARPAAGVRKVRASQGVEVVAAVGGPEGVTVEGDANLMPLVSTAVDGDTLTAKVIGSFRTRNPLRVRVAVKELVAAAADSGGAVKAENVRGGSWAADVSSGGRVEVSGAVDGQTVAVSSGGAYAAGDLTCRTAQVDVSSGGSAAVRATEAVTGAASSGGSVRYAGAPAKVAVTTSSGGSCSPAGG